MKKAERDNAMVQMDKAARDQFRHILRELHSQMKASSGRRVTASELLQSREGEFPPPLRAALQAVLERDDMGPKEGEQPPDFFLKKRGSQERVRLSSFRGRKPVALVFGSYT